MRNLISGVVVAVVLLLASASSRGASVVAPFGWVNTEGPTHNYYPFNLGGTLAGGTSQRYQQVFEASDFDSISGPITITQIAFRPDVTGRAFSVTLADIQINLSTISLGPDGLSFVFANNVGLNDTIVLARGPLALSSNFSGPQIGPLDFDVVITLTTPFIYDPAAGNLLLDVRNFGGGTTTLLDAVDATGDSIGRAFTTISSPGLVDSQTAGHGDSAGLVTKFTYIPGPEPGTASLLLVGAGLCFVSIQRRLRPPKL